MPKNFFKNEDLWIKLEEYTFSLGVDLEVIKHIIDSAKKDIVFRNSNQLKGKSLTSIDTKLESEDAVKSKGGNVFIEALILS